jgi:hypothetical protein
VSGRFSFQLALRRIEFPDSQLAARQSAPLITVQGRELTDQLLDAVRRFADMQDRLARLEDRASKRRQIAKDVMVDLDLKKLTAPDFTASIRPGIPSLMVIDEDAVPKTHWEPGQPRLRRQILAHDLKQGEEVAGAVLAPPEPFLTVRTR